MPIKRSSLSIIGAVLNVVSVLLFNYAVIRPNRISSGSPLRLLNMSGFYFFILLTAAMVILAFSLISTRHKLFELMPGISSLLFFALMLLFLGDATRSEIYSKLQYGRFSLGSGFWVSLVSIIIVIRGGLHKSIIKSKSRTIFYLTLIAMTFIFIASGYLDEISIMKEYAGRRDVFLEQITMHFLIAVASVATGAALGVPLGIFIYRSNRNNSILLFLINLGQTIPTLSLLGLIMIPLAILSEKSMFLRGIGIKGIGVAPAFIILVVYSLFPIVHNTISGLKMVDRDIVLSAYGMGMKSGQTLRKIELPLSMPVIIGGIRTAMTQSVGNAILAGLIGGGGLGSIIFLGLAQAAPDLMLLGVIPLIVMTVVLDYLLSLPAYFHKNRI